MVNTPGQVPLALSASLSWLELTHIEFDGFAVFLAPVHGVLQGVQLVTFKRAFERAAVDLETFGLVYTGAVAALLSLPALISYAFSSVPYDASWESIDYVSALFED